jgi:starch phosphorylase
LDVKDGKSIAPQTFIFGAKAAPSYYHAKRVISLINCLSAHILHDEQARKYLTVYFVENYNVTVAEKLIPASEVSQQISTAGKEASGTSNMKFMLNGALTVGTLDGANVEMRESVGDDNIFIFGLHADEVNTLYQKGYYASSYYSRSEHIRRTVEFLKTDFGGDNFSDLAAYLTTAAGIADPYLCLADFEDYLRAHNAMDALYAAPHKWADCSLRNIAEAGRFSADRSIDEYAARIWGLTRVK